jgi:hypothetical protein
MTCLALAMLACVCLQAPSASAAEKAIWGPLELPGGRSAFPLYRSLGVDTYQATLDWRAVAPREPRDARDPDDPAYRWPAEIDDGVAEARRNGIGVALLVSRSPAWANGGRSAVWVPRASAYADFLAAASRRYPSVRRWMIWGEPNSANTFRPNHGGSTVGPRAYARILDAAYAALKRVSRRNVVIGGMSHTGGTVRPAAFLRFMRLPSGRPPRLDWYGHNPFPISFPSLRNRPVRGGFRDISDLDTFSGEVARAYTRRCRPRGERRCGRRPKLWLSEFLVQSDHGSKIFARSVTKAQQARWLRAAYEIVDGMPSVAGLGWLSLLDMDQKPRSVNWGLMTSSGERKPAFYAYSRAPSRAFRPVVRGPRGVSRAAARSGPVLTVTARARGVATLALRSPKGLTLARTRQRVRAGRPWRVRISGALLRVPGRYAIVVDAPRGERVRRRLAVD